MQETLRTTIISEVVYTLLLASGSFLLTLVTGRGWVHWLRAKKVGKQVREEGPQSHLVKTGTPTMGGVMIVTSVTIMTASFNLVDRWSMVLPLSVLISFAIVGAFDDFLSLTGSTSHTYGLTMRVKFVWQLALAFIAALAIYLPREYFGLATEGLVQVPFVGSVQIAWYWYIPIAVFVIVAVANAVNFTDGLDGLAAWTLVLAFSAFGVISFIAYPRLIYLQAFCFTLAGANMAFLWFNAHPAQVFMGDLGSLAMGATLAVVALISQHWLLLPIIGVVFVAETLSVMLQVSYFKWTRRSGEAKRLFKMAPLHNHFELSGWSEMQTMQRFVVVALIAAVIGVALALSTPESLGR